MAETLAELIGLPLWFGPTVVVLTILGFPVLLLTSYLQGGRTDRIPLEVDQGFARSYEALGEKEKAAEHYRWILDLWSDPDPEVMPRVEELREALARLQ